MSRARVIWHAVAATALAWAGAAFGDPLPAPWMHVPINADKRPTQYRLDSEPPSAEGATLLHARARSSASLAVQPAPFELSAVPVVSWRWKILAHPDQPDPTLASNEDAAARLVFFFDGERARLPLVDRLVMTVAGKLGTRQLPYATLMYVSAPGRTEGDTVANPYTRRIQMIVVDGSPATAAAHWREFRRNLRDDYRRAFKEEPGRLIGWGLMTDSDNTRSAAEAVYGPVRFEPAP